MSSKKFIRGVSNRGSEVIKSLENFGGVNTKNCSGGFESLYYYIGQGGSINSVSADSDTAFILTSSSDWEEIKLATSLPKTWEEWVELNPEIFVEYSLDRDGEIWTSSSNIKRDVKDFAKVKTKSDIEGLLALIKLKRLRDFYNDTVEGEWPAEIPSIVINSQLSIVGEYLNHNKAVFLSFKSEKVRDEFLNNFKDLIKEASPWLKH